MSIYIKSIVAVSAQDTFETNLLPDTLQAASKWMRCVTPEFKNYIPAKVLRRMNRYSRISSVCAFKSLLNIGLDKPDAIITATSMGCVEDSERFLNQILDNKEMLLTPTSFIQSTHNAVGSNLALAYQCKGYNMVYTHDNNAFETALQDASIKVMSGGFNNILIGATDEITEENYNLKGSLGKWKSAGENNLDFLVSKTPGTIPGEGATFMVVSHDAKDAELNLRGLEVFYSLKNEQSLLQRIKSFLDQHNFNIQDLDTILLSIDGDTHNDAVFESIMVEELAHANICYYKHMCGSYDSDGAFALWVASRFINSNSIPDYAFVRDSNRITNNVLIVRQNFNKNFSLVLVEGCSVNGSLGQ